MSSVRGSLTSAIVVGASVGWFCAYETQQNRATVIVEAEISSGDKFGLYYNNLWSEPQWQNVVVGQWHSYEFNIPTKLFMIRLDPVREVGAIARIKNIRFRGGNGETKSLDLSTLKLWIGNNFNVEYDNKEALATILSTGKDTFLMGAVDVDIGSPTIPVLGQLRLDGISLMWSIVFSALFYAALSVWPDWKRIIHSSTLLLASLILAAVMGRFVTGAVHFSPPSPHEAVGHAAYFATSKRNDVAAVLAVLAVSVLVTLVGGWLLGGRKRLVLTMHEPQSSPLWRSRFVWAGAVCFGIVSFPQLHAIALSVIASHHPSDFDSQNITMWEYLTWKGFLPYRDFWFPYSGLYNKFLPFPPDVMRQYLLTWAVFIVVFVCLYELLGRRWAALSGLCILFIALGSYGFLLPRGNWRYFLSLSLVLLAAVALTNLRTAYFVTLGLWMGYVAMQEVSQVLYALLPVSALITATLLLAERSVRLQFRSKILWFVGTFFGFLLIWISLLAKDGQAREWWGFVSTLGIQADYSAWPADVVQWFSVPFTIDQFGMFFIALLLVGGILLITASNNEISVHSLVPLAIGCLSVTILQKQIVRPSITTQFVGIPLAGLGYLVLQLGRGQFDTRSKKMPPGSTKMAHTGAAFCAAAIISGFFVFSATGKLYIQSDVDELMALPQNLSCLFSHQDEWRRAENAFFAPESIQLHEKSGVWLRAAFEEKTKATDATVFVLGDSSFWYLLLDKPTPFYLSFYNQSPIFAQRKTVEWLTQRQPRFVLWDPDDDQFDGVPNQARVPLVFAYIATHYVPDTNVDKYLLLRRRRPSEPTDVDFWKKRLGDSMPLGALPAIAHVDPASEASSTGTMMVVHIDKPVGMKERSVPLSLGPISYSVRFFELAQVYDYHVRLDRVPLIEAALINGWAPKLFPSRSGDCRIVLQTYKLNPDTLY